MKKVFNTALEAKVDARNRLSAAINNVLPLFIANFTPLVGQKIMKAAGILEKYKGLVPKVSEATGDTPGVSLLPTSSNYNFSFRIKTESWYNHRNPANGPCIHYEEDIIYVGGFQDNGGLVLSDMYKFEPRKTDYSAADVLAKRAAANLAEAQFRSAESACFPFGRDDRE